MPLDYKSFDLDFKEVDSDGNVRGYASVYGNVDNGGDIVMPDAFAGCVAKNREQGSKIKMLWQHDPSQPIGVWDKLSTDSKGLIVEGKTLREVQKGAEALALVRAGAIGGLSIGYRTLKENWRQTDKGSVREILEAALWETSLVTFPMNEMAMVTDVKQLQSPLDVERILRKAGVPNGFAKLVARYGFEGAERKLTDGPREEDDDSVSKKQMTDLLNNLKGIKELFNAQG